MRDFADKAWLRPAEPESNLDDTAWLVAVLVKVIVLAFASVGLVGVIKQVLA